MKKIRFLVALLVLFLVVSELIGQPSSDLYERAKFTKEGEVLKYRILYPEGFSESKKYPVMLFLHGAGEKGDDNEKQLVHGSSLFTRKDNRQQFPAVVIFPQCAKGDFWSNAEVDRNVTPPTLIYLNGGKPTRSLQLVMDLMDSIKNLGYSMDRQIYVGGLSMGGMGTFEILYRQPKMYAAAFPICGGGNPETVKKYDPGLSIWVFHGAKDDVVLPSESIDMVIALKKAKFDVRYTLYKDANHNSWDPAFAEPELIPWIFSKKRNIDSL